MSFMENRERGSAILVVFILTGVIALALASSLNTAATQINATKNTKNQIENYYSAENTLNTVLNWLRDNSIELTASLDLSAHEFYYMYDFVSFGNAYNDSSNFAAPTRIRMNGTNNVPMLVNNNSLGTSAFPSNGFNALSSFQAINFNNNLVRLVMVDAIPTNPGKDYGDIDNGNQAPETDFYPVFRVDVMNQLNQGTYLYGFIIGSVVSGSAFGFFGEDYVEMRQGCDSYQSDNGSYTTSSRRANCDVGSGGPIRVLGGETVYGDLTTTNSVETTSPWGGDVCANFTTGCPDQGSTCEGTNCSVPTMPTYQQWSTYCPSDLGNLNVSGGGMGTILTPASFNAPDNCWNTIRIGSNRTLTLTSTSIPYYINTLDIANNGVLELQPDSPSGIIEIYTMDIVGDRFNGNQIFNMNNNPYQLKIHYLGTDDLTLNGTVDMGVFIVAPNAGVTVSGNFDFYGGIQAKNLTFSGSGSVHYDESGQAEVISDIQFTLRNMFQNYR